MFRNVLLRSTRALPRVAAPTYRPATLQLSPFRAYSASALSSEDITSRILDVLKSFEKVDPAKVTVDSSFTTDLGLDSLDTVEVVMAIEEEFSLEIDDASADQITTVAQAIEYISNSAEAH